MKLSHEVPVLLLIFLFAFSILPAIAGNPSIREFQLLTGDTGIRLSVDDQEGSDIAKGDSTYLLVWTDSRTVNGFLASYGAGPYFEPLLGNMRDIYAARFDPDGNPIDSAPIIVSNASYNQANPRVAWNGENWLVVWLTERDAYFYDDVVAARVTLSGEVLDDPPIVIRQDTEVVLPVVTSDGTNWLIAWTEFTGGVRGVKGIRVGPDGIPLDPAPVQLRLDWWNSYASEVDIEFALDEYLLVWTESVGGRRAARGQRFTPDLLPIDAAPFTIDGFSSSDTERPRVATDGTSFFVVWHEDWSFTWQRIWGARIAHNGQILDPNGILIVDFQANMSFEPVVAWDGANWFIAYNGEGDGFDDDLYLKRVSPAGNVLDPAGIPVRIGSTMQREPEIAPGVMGGTQVVWTESGAPSNGRKDIYRAMVDANGTVTPGGPVSAGLPRQTRGRLAARDSVHLVVFLSEVSGESRVLTQRIDELGNPIDPEPVEVGTGPEGSIRSPSVTWNGSLYLVVWERQNDIYGRRVAADGVIIDPTPLLVLPDNDLPDVAALGDLFLVVGSHSYSGDQRALQGVRFRGSDGVLLDSSPIWIGINYDLDPRVSALGNRWFIVWERQVSHNNTRSEIKGIFVEQGGNVSNSFVIDQLGEGDDPDLAVNGDMALVVYSDNDDFQDAKIDGRFVDSGGSLLGTEFRIVDAPGHQYFPAVDWDGQQYLVTWVDYRDVAYLDQLRGDIYVARIDEDGNVKDSSGVQLSSEPFGEEFPEITGIAGRFLLSYSKLDSPNGVPETYRVGVQLFEEDLPGLLFTGPIPGLAGTVNDFQVRGATPGETIYFIYGLQFGSSPLPGCPGETVHMAAPILAGTAVADPEGVSTFSAFVPGGASGLTVRLQAVEHSSCSVSNSETHTFP